MASVEQPPPPSPPDPPTHGRSWSGGDDYGRGDGRFFAAFGSDLRALLASSFASPESALKAIGLLLTYAAMGITSELGLRVSSLLSATCSTLRESWLKWPAMNWPILLMQSGLLLRATLLTWRVVLASFDFRLSEREQRLYEAHFARHGLTQREFHQLLRAGAEWHTWPPKPTKPTRAGGGAGRLVLTSEGRKVCQLVLITDGQAAVYKGNTYVATLGPGALVGEGSFARGEAQGHCPKKIPRASATVVVNEGCVVEYVAWPIKRLSAHMAHSAHVKACLMTIVAAAQAEKLMKATVQYSRGR